jgi:hypothetical protein
MRSTVFLDVTQYSLVVIYQHLYREDGGNRFLRISDYIYGLVVWKMVAFIMFCVSLLLFN